MRKKWRWLNSIQPLINTFPSDIIERDHDKGYYGPDLDVMVDDWIYVTFEPPIQEKDWTRFKIYASYVRELKVDWPFWQMPWNCQRLHYMLIYKMITCRHPSEWHPNLERIQVVSRGRVDTAIGHGLWLPSLINQNLKDLEIGGVEGHNSYEEADQNFVSDAQCTDVLHWLNAVSSSKCRLKNLELGVFYEPWHEEALNCIMGESRLTSFRMVGDYYAVDSLADEDLLNARSQQPYLKTLECLVDKWSLEWWEEMVTTKTPIFCHVETLILRVPDLYIATEAMMGLISSPIRKFKLDVGRNYCIWDLYRFLKALSSCNKLIEELYFTAPSDAKPVVLDPAILVTVRARLCDVLCSPKLRMVKFEGMTTGLLPVLFDKDFNTRLHNSGEIAQQITLQWPDRLSMDTPMQNDQHTNTSAQKGPNDTDYRKVLADLVTIKLLDDLDIDISSETEAIRSLEWRYRHDHIGEVIWEEHADWT